ncbi:MAG: hypothetical protein IJE84_01145 [Clostridia bacterium]|nr:hypothetical protein [Clostridia bacterium]
MTNDEMLLNLISQSWLGMIPENDEDLTALRRKLNQEGGDRHAEYQGDQSRWVDLTPEQIQQSIENVWEE